MVYCPQLYVSLDINLALVAHYQYSSIAICRVKEFAYNFSVAVIFIISKVFIRNLSYSKLPYSEYYPVPNSRLLTRFPGTGL